MFQKPMISKTNVKIRSCGGYFTKAKGEAYLNCEWLRTRLVPFVHRSRFPWITSSHNFLWSRPSIWFFHGTRYGTLTDTNKHGISKYDQIVSQFYVQNMEVLCVIYAPLNTVHTKGTLAVTAVLIRQGFCPRPSHIRLTHPIVSK
ncbi:unnamed protein product [Nesidiocoris tenuis]|uniref:Uncharacterized protein n=1 Tax=Nesidiocoris tenuis TaxID=355587 RepID=A0A6H5GDP5_9HEMI|nr:unnamed protein product [Nesidiocoris tenuis]